MKIKPTIGGRCQRHPDGLVGRLFRINDPDSVRVGNCFLAGRLKPGDLFLCVSHSGDCFQTYMYVAEYSNCLEGLPKWTFGSYGIGDADCIEIPNAACARLEAGKHVYFKKDVTIADTRVYIDKIKGAS